MLVLKEKRRRINNEINNMEDNKIEDIVSDSFLRSLLNNIYFMSKGYLDH